MDPSRIAHPKIRVLFHEGLVSHHTKSRDYLRNHAIFSNTSKKSS